MPDEEVVSGATIGALLKSAREAKGVSLDEASRVTKIGKNYLSAIEEGAFDKLPNPAYLKGFLRLYATYLGLSGDEIIARYQQTLSAPAPAAPVEQPHDASPMGVERVKFRAHRRWGIPLVLLILVIVAAVIYSQTEEQREYPAPPPVRPAPAPAVAPPAPVQPAVSTAHPAQPPAAQPAPPSQPGQPVQPGAPAVPPGTPGAAPVPQPAAPATPPVPLAPTAKDGARKGVILKLRFNQDTWLNITIDGSITQRYDLKAGDVIEWKGSRSFTVDVGDGGAVEGEFNGKAFRSLGERGKPAHVELKAQ